jgi:hypothetical protein
MGHDTILPPIAGTLTHRVASYAAWKARFDLLAAERQRAGILGHAIHRGAGDEGTVCVLLTASDRAGLQRGREECGADATAKATVLVPQEDRALRGRVLAVAMLSHDVEDYDRWKAQFDVFGAAWYRAGVVGHSISRSAANPAQVIVTLQAESAQELQAALGSTEGLEVDVADLLEGRRPESPSCNLEFARLHRAAFTKAGVCSPPRISLLQDTGHWAEYPS